MKSPIDLPVLIQERVLARPFRFYRTGYDEHGKFWSVISTNPNYETLLESRGGYLVEHGYLEKALDDLLIDYTPEGFWLLFHLLNKIALTEHAHDVDLLKYKKPYDQMIESAEHVLADGPGVLESFDDSIRRYCHEDGHIVRRRRNALVALIAASDNLRAAWGPIDEYHAKTSWHQDARAIILTLRQTARHAGRKLGWGHGTSPAIRFAHQVLSDINIRVTEPDSLSGEMKRMAREEGWNNPAPFAGRA